MKSTKNKSVLPLTGYCKLGEDIAVARRKRSLTIGMMAERIGVHKNTYLKVERGDPTIAPSEFMPWRIFVLELSDALTASADLVSDTSHLDADRRSRSCA